MPHGRRSVLGLLEDSVQKKSLMMTPPSRSTTAAASSTDAVAGSVVRPVIVYLLRLGWVLLEDGCQSVADHGPDAFAALHLVEAVVDPVEADHPGHQRVEVDTTVQVVLDEVGEVDGGPAGAVVGADE